MDARILQTETTISPFMDPVGASPVLGVPVVEALRRVLISVGASSVEEAPVAGQHGGDGERLVATDDLWISEHLVKAFLKAAREAGTPSILAIECALFTEFTEAVQDLGRAQIEDKPHRLYPLVWLPGRSAWSCKGDPALDHSGLTPISVDIQAATIDLPIHRAIRPEGKLTLPMTHLGAMRINHWVHIVRANQIALMAWGSELMKVHPMRILWAALRAMSINKWRVMQKLVTKGKGCDIHPSAVVEASTLGDNVKIGANAVVRFSHLCDGVSISDQCNIQYSVLGEGASVARMGMLQGCVLYPGANSGHYGLQLCVVGRDTFVGGEVVLGDFKPKGDVMIFHRGELVSAGTNMMGCAVGHDCQVLMRATTYPGREVPNGYWILGPPHDIIAKIPKALPLGEPLISEGGVLKPYAEVIKARKAKEKA